MNAENNATATAMESHGTGGFTLTLAVSSITLIVTLILFGVCRRLFPKFYQPKAYRLKKEKEDDYDCICSRNCHETPPNLLEMEGQTFLSWLKFTLKFDESRDLVDVAGSDATMYITFLKHSFFLFLLITVISCAVILPINATATNKSLPADDLQAVRGIDIISIANIPQGSSVMWIHVISVYAFSILCYFYVYNLFKKNVELNVYERYQKNSLRARTVMISELPSKLLSGKKLKKCFGEWYGVDKVSQALVVPRIKDEAAINQLKKKRQEKLKTLKRKIGSEGNRSRDQCHITEGDFQLDNSKQTLLVHSHETNDKIRDIIAEINHIDHKISSLQMQHQPHATRTGFVTFNSVAIAQSCKQTLLHRNPHRMLVESAPDRADIQWRWLKASYAEILVRTGVVYFMMALLFLFWSVPVAFIAAFSNLSTLTKVEGVKIFVGTLSRSPLLKSLLEGLLPSLALYVFLAILPYLQKYMLSFCGYHLKSARDRDLLRFYWLFLVLNVFLVSIVAGSLFDIANKFVAKPEIVVTLLATSLPSQAVYFANYLLVQSFVGYALFWLARFDDLAICKFKQWFLCKTEEEKQQAEAPSSFPLPMLCSRELMVFGIAITYSSMSPIVLPFATVYFGMAYVTAKYNYIFVFTTEYGPTKIPRMAIDRILFSILLYQLTMTGMFALKLLPLGSTLCFLSCIVTALFYHFLKTKYYRLFDALPLQECPKPEATEETPLMIEQHQQQQQQQQDQPETIAFLYKHPALIPVQSLSSSSPQPEIDIEKGSKRPGSLVVGDEATTIGDSSDYASSHHMERDMDSIPPTHHHS